MSLLTDAVSDLVADAVSSAEVALLSPAATLLGLFLAAISKLDLSSKNYPEEAIVEDGECFDFIIGGAGSAGCVVANRLSEDGNSTVLLVEAGDDPPIDALIPGLFPFVAYTDAEWNYFPINDNYSSQTFQDDMSFGISIGKMLGGSSGSNYMFAVRGNKQDYADWTELGIQGWSWDDVLPYFKKSERMTDQTILDSESGILHNDKGLLGISRPEWGDQSTVYLDAFREQGHNINLDNNGFIQLGYSQPQFTIADKLRQNTAVAFLYPARNRENLKLMKNTYVRRVIFNDDNVATGVEVSKNGEIKTLCANKEVILSAGALNTPNILMRSGVGPKEHLEENGVKVVYDSPNVGQNLQDHPTSLVSITGEQDLLSVPENLEILLNLDTFPTPSIMGYASLNKTATDIQPDYEVLAFPFPAAAYLPTLVCTHQFRYVNPICLAIANGGQKNKSLFTLLTLLHPESRGEVRLNGTDPANRPLIRSGFYSDDRDLEKQALCMEDYISLVNTTYMKSVGAEIVNYNIEQCKHLTFLSHEYWKCHILNMGQTEWHYCGTTAMGPDGVVDDRLNVRGVTGLRVADAGIMPLVTSGNTNLPSIMIGEKASDMIKEDYGIPIDPLN